MKKILLILGFLVFITSAMGASNTSMKYCASEPSKLGNTLALKNTYSIYICVNNTGYYGVGYFRFPFNDKGHGEFNPFIITSTELLSNVEGMLSYCTCNNGKIKFEDNNMSLDRM